MKKQVEKLHQIANKKTRRIIGLMSGTSLDGLDIALCSISGSGSATAIVVEEFETIAYSDDEKEILKQVFANANANLELVCHINAWLGKLHAAKVNECLAKWKEDANDIDLIASHGQTIYHAPYNQHKKFPFKNSTLQIGDGDQIAINTGVITIADFRQKHVAAGGEGAPLAGYGDLLIFGDAKCDTILINIGGISNFTVLPADESNLRSCCTDAGPGNTLMDGWMRAKFDLPFDKNGEIASSGSVIEPLLNELLTHEFFSLPFPKTTGPELFNAEFVDNALTKLKINAKAKDVMATLATFTVESIIRSLEKADANIEDADYYISGGGIHNPVVMKQLTDRLRGKIRSTEEKGIPPDAKEAVLFALLANELVAGNGQMPGNLLPITMGKICFPL